MTDETLNGNGFDPTQQPSGQMPDGMGAAGVNGGTGMPMNAGMPMNGMPMNAGVPMNGMGMPMNAMAGGAVPGMAMGMNGMNAAGMNGMNAGMAAQPPLLLGTYTPKIDAKGRMALPAKMRSQLGDGLVMARGQERCVYLLPAMEFRRIAMQIQRTSMGNKSARDYLRVFLSGAVDQGPDKQGRVLVPQMLRDYANLGSDIVVIGVGTRAEIWNREAWETYLAEKEQGYSDIADDVLPEVAF